MAHPTEAADHDLNRGKICAPCGIKVKSKSLRNITPSILTRMLQFYPDFDLEDRRFPNVICSSCNNKINAAVNDDSKRDMVPDINKQRYQDIILIKETRSGSLCYCLICLRARSIAHVGKSGFYGKKRSLSPEQEKGYHAAQFNEPISSVPCKVETASNHKICYTCHQEF